MVAALSITFLTGCKHDIDNNEAVRQGILSYFAKRPDLLSMDVSVTDVKYRQNEATATVRLQAKNNNSPAAGMTMTYVLDRKGKQWVVKGRAGSEMHGTQPMGMTPGESGPGSIGAMPQTTLPPGHPSTGAGSGTPGNALPPGHPPVSSQPGKSK